MDHQKALEGDVLVALRRIMRAFDLRSRSLMLDFGLTGPQLAALQAAAQKGTVTAGGIAREIHVGQPTVTGILDRLERRGLVERVRGQQDRRKLDVRVTEEGRRVLQRAPSLFQDQFCQRLRQLAEWERTQMLATLQRIAAMMESSDGTEEPAAGDGFRDVFARPQERI